jgi:hypothetical protein
MSDSRIETLDKMLRLRFQRSAPIEEALMQSGMGQRDLPSREECREWAVKLGVPDDVREVLAAQPTGDVGELVATCRRYADSLIKTNDLSCGPLMARCALLDAAAEIERLRAALQKIAQHDIVFATKRAGQDIGVAAKVNNRATAARRRAKIGAEHG